MQEANKNATNELLACSAQRKLSDFYDPRIVFYDAFAFETDPFEGTKHKTHRELI